MKTLTRITLGSALLTGSLVSAQEKPQTPPPRITSAAKTCNLAGQGEMGVGWLHHPRAALPDQDRYYRCLPIFDENLKPAGAAWVQVQKDGTVGENPYIK